MYQTFGLEGAVVSAKPPPAAAHLAQGCVPVLSSCCSQGWAVRSPIPAAALTGTGDDLGAVVGPFPKCARLL